MGKAYAVFDCNASKEEIESTLPVIRALIGTPKELEVSIIDLTRMKITDSEKLAQAHMKYVLQATHPNMGNKQTAEEITAILNQAYLTPLYEKGRP